MSADAPTVQVTFRHADGETTSVVDAKVGESLLQTAHRYGLDLEGACEGGTHTNEREFGCLSATSYISSLRV